MGGDRWNSDEQGLVFRGLFKEELEMCKISGTLLECVWEAGKLSRIIPNKINPHLIYYGFTGKGLFFNKLSIYTMGGLGKPPASLILGAFTQYFKMVILLLTLLHCSGPLADEV